MADITLAQVLAAQEETLDERRDRELTEGEWRARGLAGSGNPMRASFENDAANAWWEKWINRGKAGTGGVAAAALLPKWPVGTLAGAWDANDSGSRLRRWRSGYRLLQPVVQGNHSGSGAMAAAKKVARPDLTADYDRDADVLYVALEPIAPAEGEDGPRGVVLRYSMDANLPCGVTVVGYRRNRWPQDTAALSNLIGKHLGLHPAGILLEIERATRDATSAS